jgi:hypothetical protein
MQLLKPIATALIATAIFGTTATPQPAQPGQNSYGGTPALQQVNSTPTPFSIEDYAVVSRGPNHAVRERTVYEPGPSGRLVARVHRVTELGSGLNHLNDQGEWELC